MLIVQSYKAKMICARNGNTFVFVLTSFNTLGQMVRLTNCKERLWVGEHSEEIAAPFYPTWFPLKH